MTKKKRAKKATKSGNQNGKSLSLLQQPTEPPAEAMAHKILRPAVQAAVTLMQCNRGMEISINTLVSDLRKQCLGYGMTNTHATVTSRS